MVSKREIVARQQVRCRLTIRRLMVVVAVVALLLGVGVGVVELRRRSAAYRQRSFDFFGQMLRSGSIVTMADGRWFDRYSNENTYRERAWAAGLAEKYWRLADRPWLPVEPDPPPPEPLAHPQRVYFSPDTSHREVFRPFEPSAAPWWTVLWTWRN